MTAEIISVGTELLLGNILNTNAQYLSRELAELGITVQRESCTNAEFYEKMRAAKGIPSTAAITPLQFCEKYCQYD